MSGNQHMTPPCNLMHCQDLHGFSDCHRFWNLCGLLYHFDHRFSHASHQKMGYFFLFVLNQKKIYRPFWPNFFPKWWTCGRNYTVWVGYTGVRVRVGFLQPSSYPYPWHGLVVYPPSWSWVFFSEFESRSTRSTMINTVDLAFHIRKSHIGPGCFR